MRLPRISKILNVEPFKITALWNNGEIRINDFTKSFERWEKSENAHLLGLTAWEVFKGVTVGESRTLEWTNYPTTFTFDGRTQTAPTDLDPDVLYQESTFVRMIELGLGKELRLEVV
jgi:hypothetical protein